MTLKDQINEVKHRMSAPWDHKCVVCGCEYSKSGMVFHHLWYLKKGDVIYSDYLPRNDTNTLRYHLDLEPLVKKNPKRFRYYCVKDHFAVEKAVNYSDEKWAKINIERNLTKTYKNG